MSKTKYISKARWTKCSVSEDEHNDHAFASAICIALYEEWGEGKPPCPVRGNCISAWVEIIEPNSIDFIKEE